MNSLVSFVKKHYDRLIAALVLLVLVGSLMHLAVRVGGARSMRRNFVRELEELTPEHEHASELDVTNYRSALGALENPRLLNPDSWTNSMTVPERRVWCIDCKMPIPYKAETCPFCDERQPRPRGTRTDLDSDEDGIPDQWERAHDMDPFDAADAAMDPDGDGYSNLAEYKADPHTNPRDAESFPPPEKELWLVRIEAQPFNLLFRSKITMPDGSLKFGINTRDRSRTFFAREGEEVAGFVIENYEEKTREVRNESLGTTVEKDVSELTLSRKGKKITLVLGNPVEYSEHTATLKFAVEDRQFRVKKGDQFVLKGVEYRVIGIDTAQQNVLIKKLRTGEEIKIGTRPQAS
jgi:hypothetical protein